MLTAVGVLGWHLGGLSFYTLVNSFLYYSKIKGLSKNPALVRAILFMILSISAFLMEITLYFLRLLPEFGVWGEIILFLPSLIFVPLNFFWILKTMKLPGVRWYRALVVVISLLLILTGILS